MKRSWLETLESLAASLLGMEGVTGIFFIGWEWRTFKKAVIAKPKGRKHLSKLQFSQQFALQTGVPNSIANHLPVCILKILSLKPALAAYGPQLVSIREPKRAWSGAVTSSKLATACGTPLAERVKLEISQSALKWYMLPSMNRIFLLHPPLYLAECEGFLV